MASVPFLLVARRGPLAGRSYALAGSVTWLGRAHDAPVPLTSPEASPRHAELEVTANGVLLRNLDMRVGTRVGGYKVHVTLLSEGQTIEVGEDAFELRVEAGAPRGTLTCVDGPSAGRVFTLHDHTLTMGRLAEAHVILYTQRASRRHAELRPLPDGVHVVDLGSGNGTLVGGRRITDHVLQPGDIVEIGEERFRFDEPTVRTGPSPLAVSGLDFGAGSTSVSPTSQSRAPAASKKGGTLQLSPREAARHGVGGGATPAPLPRHAVCPTCGRTVDERYESCPWDGARLRER